MVSVSELLQQHDKEKEEPPKLTKKEKQKLKKIKKKLEREAKLRKSQEDEMAREINVAKKNIEAFRSKWKEIRMEKGRPEYKDYMMEHWSLFDHIMDKKDELIELFCDELEHTERTRRTAQVDDIMVKDQLLKDFYNVLEEIKVNMYTGKEQMLMARNARLQQYTEECSRTDENMRLIAYLIDQNKKRDEQMWSSEFITKFDEEVSKDRSDRELLIARTEVRMMALWKEYRNVLDGYKMYSQSILKRSEPLLEKVKADDQLIIEQKHKLNSMLALIEIAKYRSKKGPKSTILRDLRGERAELYGQYTKQKKRLTDLQQHHNMKIQHQVKACLEVSDRFTTIIRQGEEIFKYYELTKRLETKHEGFHPVHNELTYSRGAHILGDLPVRTKMIKFWKRVGRAEMLMALMVGQRNKAKKEKQRLKQYMVAVMKTPELHTLMGAMQQCVKTDK